MPLLKRMRFELVLAAIALVATVLSFLAASGRLTTTRSSTEDSIAISNGVLASARAERAAKPKRVAQLKSFVDHSLGGTAETADSALRARVNRVLEELSLPDASVGTSAAVIQGTPARAEFARGSLKKLRDEPDFGEIQATVAASGRYDQMLRLLYRIATEPWLHRIDMVRFDPKSGGERVSMSVRLTALFIVGGQASVELQREGDPVVGFAPYLALAASNPYFIPSGAPVVAVSQNQTPIAMTTPVPAEAVAVVPPEIINSGFPYSTWMLTGVIRGPTGDEAFLRCVDGSAMQLVPGQAVGELVFRGVTFDLAEFESSGGRVRVRIGDNLAQRSPIGQ